MITTGSSITKDMTPAEAANLLTRLQEGHQAAWRSTREVPWHSAEYEARFENAAEVDGLFRDVMWETAQNGMRHPGEAVEQFAERAETQARQAHAPQAATEATSGRPIDKADLSTAPEHGADRRGETAARLRNGPSTSYARAFSDGAARHVKELRERDPLPEPDRTPGAPHPDPFLAARGWHINEHGIYTRAQDPQASPRPEKELEAG